MGESPSRNNPRRVSPTATPVSGPVRWRCRSLSRERPEAKRRTSKRKGATSSFHWRDTAARGAEGLVLCNCAAERILAWAEHVNRSVLVSDLFEGRREHGVLVGAAACDLLLDLGRKARHPYLRSGHDRWRTRSWRGEEPLHRRQKADRDQVKNRISAHLQKMRCCQS